MRDQKLGQPPQRNPAERRRELSALLPLWPKDIDDVTTEGRGRLIAVLERALRAERRRGIAGHWTYDLARHAALHRAWTRERTDLKLQESENMRRTMKRGLLTE
ncbi:MAG: hypothetical protein ACKVP4_04505 [Hyphomicrobium sp.]